MEFLYILITFLILLITPIILSGYYFFNYLINKKFRTQSFLNLGFWINYIILTLISLLIWYLYASNILISVYYDALPDSVFDSSIPLRTNINPINVLWLFPIFVYVFDNRKQALLQGLNFFILLFFISSWKIGASSFLLLSTLGDLFSNLFFLLNLLTFVFALLSLIAYDFIAKKQQRLSKIVVPTLSAILIYFLFSIIVLIQKAGTSSAISILPFILIVIILNPLFVFTYALVAYYILRSVDLVFKNAVSLSELTIFTSKNYLRFSAFNEAIYNYLQSYGINLALLLTFRIRDYNLANNNQQKSELFQMISEKFEEKFDCLFFQIDNRNFGVFVSSNFEALVPSDRNQLVKMIDFYLAKKIEPLIKNKISIAASIYNYHSSNINHLLEYNNFMLSNFYTNENYLVLNLYDYSFVKEINQTREQAQQLLLIADFNKFDVYFNELMIEKNKIIYPVSLYIDDSWIWYSNLLIKLKDKIDEDFLIRYLAMRIIKKINTNEFKDYLAIPYRFELILNNKISHFIDKLEINNLNLNQIAFIFDKNDYLKLSLKDKEYLKEINKKYHLFFLVSSFEKLFSQSFLVKQQILFKQQTPFIFLKKGKSNIV